MDRERNFIPVIGVTGGIGSGKTTVVDRLRQEDAHIISADSVAKDLLWNDREIHDKVVAEFGDIIVDENGIISKEKLKSEVFRDQNHIERLNKIVHPSVRKTINEEVEKLRAEKLCRLIVQEVPLIYEAGIERFFDTVISVVAEKEIRITRVLEHGRLTREEVLQRMNLQVDDKVHWQKSDYVLENNSTKEDLLRKLEIVLQDIYKRYQ